MLPMQIGHRHGRSVRRQLAVKHHMGGKGATLKTDLRKIVQIARESGYRGYLPIETLPVPREEYDPRARVHQCLQELRAALRE
jgi:hypothetical protein